MPLAESVAMPLDGAVHVHHAVCPLETPAITGSPVSSVAPASEPVAFPPAAASVMRSVKLSLTGPATADRAAAASSSTIHESRRCFRIVSGFFTLIGGGQTTTRRTHVEQITAGQSPHFWGRAWQKATRPGVRQS